MTIIRGYNKTALIEKLAYNSIDWRLHMLVDEVKKIQADMYLDWAESFLPTILKVAPVEILHRDSTIHFVDYREGVYWMHHPLLNSCLKKSRQPDDPSYLYEPIKTTEGNYKLSSINQWHFRRDTIYAALGGEIPCLKWMDSDQSLYLGINIEGRAALCSETSKKVEINFGKSQIVQMLNQFTAYMYSDDSIINSERFKTLVDSSVPNKSLIGLFIPNLGRYFPNRGQSHVHVVNPRQYDSRFDSVYADLLELILDFSHCFLYLQTALSNCGTIEAMIATVPILGSFTEFMPKITHNHRSYAYAAADEVLQSIADQTNKRGMLTLERWALYKATKV